MNRFIPYICLFIIILSCSKNNDASTNMEEEESEEIKSNLPNILFVIADDMGLDASPGYNFGNIKPNMPNLESLMSSGIKFNNVWSSPTCSPTRAGLITGKYGFRTNVLNPGDVLSETETSLQRYIDVNTNNAYANAVIGKWHLSTDVNHPNTMGVDYFAGFTNSGGIRSYTDWTLNINGTSSPSTDYTTSKFTDLAINWVSQQTKPWFLWLAYNAPHTPFHLPPNDLHSQGILPSDNTSINTNPLPYYLASLEALDTEMGRMINSLSEEEKANTIIIFIGDNGTPGQVVQEYETRRSKGSVYQGGVNVPMVISGKNVTRVNTTEDALINTTDLFATIADIAGTETTEIHDSKSFKSLLSTTGNSQRNYTYSENEDFTIRNTTHKYIIFNNGSEALYNLINNPLEDPNLLSVDELPLSEENTTIKNELTARLDEIKR